MAASHKPEQSRAPRANLQVNTFRAEACVAQPVWRRQCDTTGELRVSYSLKGRRWRQRLWGAVAIAAGIRYSRGSPVRCGRDGRCDRLAHSKGGVWRHAHTHASSDRLFKGDAPFLETPNGPDVRHQRIDEPACEKAGTWATSKAFSIKHLSIRSASEPHADPHHNAPGGQQVVVHETDRRRRGIREPPTLKSTTWTAARWEP